MKKIALLGFGVIGKKLYEQILKESLLEIIFIYDPKEEVPTHLALANPPSGDDFAKVDLVIEIAASKVVESFGREIVKHTDLMPFSLTALANQKLFDDILEVAILHQHRLFIPHGAILGLDGIFDGRNLFDEVQIVTIKNPKSLGRNDMARSIVYEGNARDVAELMPKNVNVHAALALAGIGFDKTKSVLISDPGIKENTHMITVKNADTVFEIVTRSNPIGAVTGAFTPISAYGSIKRALGICEKGFLIV